MRKCIVCRFLVIQVAVALGKEGISKSMRATFSKGLGSAIVLEPVLLFRNVFSIKTRKVLIICKKR